jgi:hypothetical protein
MGSGLDMGHIWPFDNPRYILTKRIKTVPVPAKARTTTVFAGSYMRLRDYQTSSSIIPPPFKKDEGS